MKSIASKTLLVAALFAACSWASAGTLSVVVVDRDNNPVPDAIVTVVPSDTGVSPRARLPRQAVIYQEKMQFIPAMTLVAPGAKVRFVNNDPWEHRVRSSPAGSVRFSSASPGFEFRLDGKTDGKQSPENSTEVTLNSPGVFGPTLLGCFIHGGMRGYIYVSESPWAVKTNAEGLAVFEDLPNGVTLIKVWQAEQLAELPAEQAIINSEPTKNIVHLNVVIRKRRI